MASEAPPPPYNPDPGYPDPGYPPNAPPPQAYPPNSAPYPSQASSYPPAAPPSYSSQDQTKAGYPVQAGPYPQQGVPPGYSQPGYGPTTGAAVGYTTQGVGYYPQHTNQTTVITQQPAGAVIIHNRAPPPDFMVVSIISMFCCFFIGIFAMLKSVRSRELWRAGDFAGAQETGMRARRLANIAIFTGICIYVFIVILRIVLSITVK